MPCLPCFAEKVEKKPSPKVEVDVDVPDHVEEVMVVPTVVVTPPPPDVEETSPLIAVQEEVMVQPIVEGEIPSKRTQPTTFVEPPAPAEPRKMELSQSFVEPTFVVQPRLLAEPISAKPTEVKSDSITTAVAINEKGSFSTTNSMLEAQPVTYGMPQSVLPPREPVEAVSAEPLEPQVEFACPVELPKAPPAVSVKPLHQAFVPEDHETLLMITKLALRDLIQASSEISINGPSYTALLHARHAVLDEGAELSVSLIPAARYPQVKVGPIRSNADTKISVRAGLRYNEFGEIVASPLRGDETARCVKYEGTPIMYLVRTGQLFTAVSPNGSRLCKTLYIEDDELGPIMQVLSEPHADMLLALVALLATFLANSKVCDDILQSTSG